ncbi:MAG: hypothetical protein BGO98_34655 [Myxococcales bacterium 68-20]|nr:MAG: hypothetical protein BGO98_34655 [Myxococcales bacterium 68-20]
MSRADDETEVCSRCGQEEAPLDAEASERAGRLVRGTTKADWKRPDVTRSNRGDVYDVRSTATAVKEYFKARPEILAVYEVILALNRHHHESAPLNEVRLVLEREAPQLGKHLKKRLRERTESALARDEALSVTEYQQLSSEWHALRGYLEDGRTIGPQVVLLLLVALVALGAALVVTRN